MVSTQLVFVQLSTWHDQVSKKENLGQMGRSFPFFVWYWTFSVDMIVKIFIFSFCLVCWLLHPVKSHVTETDDSINEIGGFYLDVSTYQDLGKDYQKRDFGFDLWVFLPNRRESLWFQSRPSCPKAWRAGVSKYKCDNNKIQMQGKLL